MPWRQLYTGGGHQLDKWIGYWRNRHVNGIKNLFILMGAGYGKHFWMSSGYIFGICAKASRYDYLAVFPQGLSNCLQAFSLGGIEKSARVNDDCVGAGVIWRNSIPLRSEAREYPLAIH